LRSTPWLLCTAAALVVTPVAAQRSDGVDQFRYDRQSPSGRNASEGIPGQFDYYTLVLSWSPTYCASQPRDDTQCRPRDGRPYAFVLHGLWPQYERGYPRFCHTRERPFVPRAIIDRMQDIMPSPRLTIHEYRKHGTCSGLDPAAYYDLARTLFARLKIPTRYLGPGSQQFVAPSQLVREFTTANPDLSPEAVAVACGGPGNRLKEVRICFTRAGEFRSCGSNERQRQLCRADRMHVPPVRPSAGGSYGRDLPRRYDREPLPGPLPGPVLGPPGQRAL